MKLFYKRPLSLILCIMLGGFCFFAGRENSFYLIASSALCAAFAIIFIFKDLFSGSRTIALLITAALLSSVVFSFFWSRSFFPYDHYENEVVAEGILVSADHSSTSESTVVLRTDYINGERDRHTIRIVGEKDELSGINVGDSVKMTITPLPFSDDASGYYTSLGYSAAAEGARDVSIVSKDHFTLHYYFDSLRHSVADRFRLISDEGTGDFLAALLTGERDAIDANTKLSFTRTGISHILALSGAHLVILAFAAHTLLRLFRLNNKTRTVIVAVIVVLYMLLTGLSASVTRAGVMLLITSTLFLLSERSDGVTSLSISVFLIVCAQPYAAFDISLWLSAFATVGLIFLSSITDPIDAGAPVIKRLWLAFVNAVLSSVFAISASMVISMFTFDSFSTLAIPATLIFSPITELLIYLGIFGLVFDGIIPMKPVLIGLTEAIKSLADAMAKPSFSLVSLDFISVKIIAVMLVAAFFIFILFADRKTAKRTIIVISALFIALNIVGAIQAVAVRQDDGVVFSPDGDIDSLLIRSDGEIALIASGSSRFKGRYPSNLATDAGIYSVDCLIIPSYSSFTFNCVASTVSSIRTEVVYLPRPSTSDEYVVAEIIARKLAEFTTDLRFYGSDEGIGIGDITYANIAREQLSAGENGDCFVLKGKDDLLTYLSTDIVNNYIQTVTTVIRNCDILIIGSDNSEITVLPEEAHEVYLGIGREASEYMLDYLNEKGTSVKSTDAPIEIDFN